LTRLTRIFMEAISVFDIFKIGVGPSSSHTMGPWRAAQRFIARLRLEAVFDDTQTIRVILYGSLAKTGKGHGTDVAVILGLSGEDPVTCDTSLIHLKVDDVARDGTLLLDGVKGIPFDRQKSIVFQYDTVLPFHPNGLRFFAE